MNVKITFGSKSSDIFRNLLNENQFKDFTLVCGSGSLIGVHKVILSARSLYFRQLFQQSDTFRPFEYFEGVHFDVLEAAVNFMYSGHVEVEPSAVDDFIRVSKYLEMPEFLELCENDQANFGTFNEEPSSIYTNETLKSKANSNSKKWDKTQNDETNLDFSYEERTSNFTNGALGSIQMTNYDSKHSEETQHCQTNEGTFNEEQGSMHTNDAFQSTSMTNLDSIKSEETQISKDCEISNEEVKPTKETRILNTFNAVEPLSTKVLTDLKPAEETEPPQTNMMSHEARETGGDPANETEEIATKEPNKLDVHIGNNSQKEQYTYLKEDFYNCDVCDFQSISKYKVLNHKRSVHEGRKFYCDQCSFSCVRPDHLKPHIESKHEMLRYPCKKCDYKGHSTFTLKLHIKNIHDQIPIPCSECNYIAETMTRMKRHKEAKHGKTLHECDKCDYKTKVKLDLYGHRNAKHSDRFHFCETCGYQAKTQSNLGRHKRSAHEGVRYACDVENCKYKATQNFVLENHKRSQHEGVKYYCDIESCDFIYTQKSNLKKHKMQRHDVTPREVIECLKCKTEFAARRSLKRHIERGRCYTV